MRFATPIAPPHRPAGRILALIAPVLIPFPVSIPLSLWLTGRRHFSDSPNRHPLLTTGHPNPDYSRMPSRGVRDGNPPRLLARKADAGVPAVRRGGRTRTASPGDRIGRRSRDS